MGNGRGGKGRREEEILGDEIGKGRVWRIEEGRKVEEKSQGYEIEEKGKVCG